MDKVNLYGLHVLHVFELSMSLALGIIMEYRERTAWGKGEKCGKETEMS